MTAALSSDCDPWDAPALSTALLALPAVGAAVAQERARPDECRR